MLDGSQFNDKTPPVRLGSRSLLNPHRLEASLVLEDHGGCCHGSRLSSSLKDVVSAERCKWKPQSLVVRRLVKSWELSSQTKWRGSLGTRSPQNGVETTTECQWLDLLDTGYFMPRSRY